MALEGLLYGAGREGLQNDKAGQPIYSGSAALFEEWKFRVMAKWDALDKAKPDDKYGKRTELASKVTDALRDDAMNIAMDLGRGQLIAPDGVPTLVNMMSESVNTKSELEATELYKERGQEEGPPEPPARREHVELRLPAQEMVGAAEGLGPEVQHVGEHPLGYAAGWQQAGPDREVDGTHQRRQQEGV